MLRPVFVLTAPTPSFLLRSVPASASVRHPTVSGTGKPTITAASSMVLGPRLEQTANVRTYSETRERPIDRFRPDALRPLLQLEPDCRDTVIARVHKDIRLRFDGNRYCVPPRLVGHELTIKADSSSVTIYKNQRQIVRYAPSAAG